MKKVLLCSFMFCLAFTAFSQQKQVGEKLKTTPVPTLEETALIDDTAATPTDVPVMTFAEEVYDYDTIQSGDKVEHIFKFTNTGTAPLVIEGAKSTCGCTVPKFPRAPIAPGESGEISVVFNSKNKSGKQRKPIHVTANTVPTVTTVHISGMVEKAK